MTTPLRIGVVGGGAIGATICRALDDGTVPAKLVGLCELDEARAAELLGSLTRPVPALALAPLADASDLVVEAVGKSAVRAIVTAAIERGADVMVMSVSGLLDADDLCALAARCGRRILVPTGAIAGLDALRAAALAGVDSVILTTTKPPRGLAGAPYVVAKQLDLEHFTAPVVIFEGSAREAVEAFPANVNVSAALALAGIGADRTRVRVVCDPTAHSNRHSIEIVGACGRVEVHVDNVPSPQNPKTSHLAAVSAIALLKRLTDAVQVGS